MALKDVILVDNAVYCFGLQLSNGVPVMPFKEDKSDREFESLTRFLVRISTQDDVRYTLSDAFSLQAISPHDKFNFDSFIEHYDYETCENEQDVDDDWEEQVR